MSIRKSLAMIPALGLALAVASGTSPNWFLQQNDPDPFCNQPGATTIALGVDESANVTLEVWHPDSSSVARTLIDGVLVPGFHSVVWDGRDDNDEALAAGAYPYHMEARDIETGELLFEAGLIATISCPTPSDRASWGYLKHRFVR